MPNVEFIARNGIVSRGNLVVSGSVISTSPASFLGSLSVTGSIVSTNNIQGNQFSSTVGSVIGGRYFSDVLIAAGTVTYGSYSTTNVANFDIYANNENVGNGALLRLSSRFGGDNGAYLVSAQTGSVVLAVNGTSNSGLVLNGSTMNVGIGVSTPTARLQAKGSGATSSTTALLVQNSNASSSLVVLDNGNVGIGVTAPTAQIHIAGQGTGTYLVKAPGINGNPQFEIYRPADNTTAIKWYDAGAATQGIIDNASSNIMTMTGNWAIANDGSSLFSTYAGYTKPAIDLYTYVYQYDFNTPLIRARVNTSNIVTNTIFQVNQNGNGYFSGSVGIGTSTPSASLHISGSSNSALFKIDSPTANNIIFVSGSGNVGIGTSTPSASLHISGAALTPLLRVSNPASVDFTIQSDSTLTDYTGLYIGNKHIIRTKNAATIFFNIQDGLNLTDNNQTRTTINSLGSFGVGVTNAASIASRLHVRGSGTTSATTAFRVENTNLSGSLTVLDNGFVGIGKNTPISTLHLGNDTGGFLGDFTTPTITFNSLNNGIYLDSNRINFKAGGGFAFGCDSNGVIGNGFRINAGLYNDLTTPIFVPVRTSPLGENSAGYGGNTAGNLSLITSGSSRLFISSSGNVGIGTITPSTSLHVVGNTILSGSAGSGSALYAYKSGSTVLDIQGSQGQLFSVIDALSGSLMSVNDISGLPIVEVFSDDRVVMGTYGAPGLTVSGSTAAVATGSSAPTGTAPEGTFKFAIAGGLYYIYAYIGGAWRSGSLA